MTLLPWILCILLVLAIAVRWALSRSGLLAGHRENLPPIARAEEALFAGRGAQARRLARRILRKDAADVDAWMVLGTAWAKDERLDKVLEELGPAIPWLKQDQVAGPAFLLALACTHQKQQKEALRWLEVAGQDPEILERVRREPSFNALRSSPSFWKLFGDGQENPAYI